jgi:hypothetical protein
MRVARGRAAVVRSCAPASTGASVGATSPVRSALPSPGRLSELGWLKRREANRSVEVTSLGRARLRAAFGLDLAA